METKKCTKCGVEKEATLENFWRNGKSLRSQCKECRKNYRHKNKERINEYHKKYRKHYKYKSKKVSRLPDYYILRRFDKNIDKEDITKDMINTRRLLIQIKREIKNGK